MSSLTNTLETSPHPKDAQLAEQRKQILENKLIDENALVEQLLSAPIFVQSQRDSVVKQSKQLVAACREDKSNRSLLDSFLQEFGLSNSEGVALMCLAEALLRIPDTVTADRLIAEKIATGDWQSHSGNSDSIFVNSATWGMILTGKLIQLDTRITQHPGTWVKSLSSKLSEPIVRRAVMQAMRLMGGQYVLGRTINEGLKKARLDNSSNNTQAPRYSFDMLGEGARTFDDAKRYYDSYANAFDHIGKSNTENNVYQANGISVKLSALHPQFHFAHAHTVMHELLPLIKSLCVKAKSYGLGLSIDAEEAARLDLSLDIFAELAADPALAEWDGLGYVLQAYQKRAPTVAQWLNTLAEHTNRRIMVRLVKGAYWDGEIKHAQEQGLDDYPVFTRKTNTDLCYLNCAHTLLSNRQNLFPQFATHNASTAVSILELAKLVDNDDFEFQRLHGMGELMYAQLKKLITQFYPAASDYSLRIYAPIGQHQDLLPYLVRRLLENGANSSFVNRFLDDASPIDELIGDVVEEVAQSQPYRHNKIPKPSDIFIHANEHRQNAQGIDLDDANATNKISKAIEQCKKHKYVGHSIINGQAVIGETINVYSPIDTQKVVGTSSLMNAQQYEDALTHGHAAKSHWGTSSAKTRAVILNNMADALEQNTHELIALINQEAGRTIDDCVSEVREAVDFCRFYALQAAKPEHNLPALGMFLCISPWNFPLAIFTGQISAALATGNCVLAKPADQTPLIAAHAVSLFHHAGCPVDVLQLLIDDGPSLGAQILPDPRLNGVAFTGSTEVATTINQTLSQRKGETIPLIAETGGQNCMVVDSTALPEQVVDDVIASAFYSAGQRCSALRVLYVQDVVSDKILTMLKGALESVQLGDPSLLSTDVGPVIDRRAFDALEQHVEMTAPIASNTMQIKAHKSASKNGNYFAPRVFEIDSIKHLKREVFGPVLHIIRYSMSELDSVIDDINSTGYGLTFGVHSRIEAFADYLCRKTTAGNNYINRTTIGAVVGVTPFGGHGLSGTGPKAGGPNYLCRFQRRLAANPTTGSKQVIDLETPDTKLTEIFNNANLIETPQNQPWQALSCEQRQNKIVEVVNKLDSTLGDIIQNCVTKVSQHIGHQRLLTGPTGEKNTLAMHQRGRLLLVVSSQDNMEQLLAIASIALCAGNTLAIVSIDNNAQQMTEQIVNILSLGADYKAVQMISEATHFFGVCVSTANPTRDLIREHLANGDGALKPLIEFDQSVLNAKTSIAYVSSMIYERTTTENLVARGGNTQLFNL